MERYWSTDWSNRLGNFQRCNEGDHQKWPQGFFLALPLAKRRNPPVHSVHCSTNTVREKSVREAIANGRWIADIAHNLNHSLLNEFFKLWNMINWASLSLQDDEQDSIAWNLKSSGQFSTRSACTIQFARHTLSSFPSLIWDWAPPKCMFFLWLLLQDRLWTAARLQQRGWENNYLCALCFRNLETAQHLFF
jgi:hypothetical protein